MTKYGNSILKIINMSTKHPTAEQIFFELRKRYPNVAMATVYNNLHSLHENHQIRKLSIEGRIDRYDKNTRHDHLICRDCGSIQDFHFHSLSEEIHRETGVEAEEYDLFVYHTCERCRTKA